MQGGQVAIAGNSEITSSVSQDQLSLQDGQWYSWVAIKLFQRQKWTDGPYSI